MKLAEYVEQYSKKPINGTVLVIKGETFLISNTVKEVYSKLKKGRPGLFLGKEDKFFKPSIALLLLLSKQPKKKAIVKHKAGWLFTLGRDVFKKNIIKAPKGKVFVYDEDNTFLGIGIWDGFMIKNVKDIGDYIRREKPQR